MARLIIATPCCLLLLASLAVGFQFDGGAKAASGPLLGLGGQPGGHVSQTEMPKRSEVDIESYVEIVFAPPQSLQARQHGRVVLECATNGRPTAEITWYKDGMPVYPKYGATGAPVHFHPGSISETRSRLEFECISFEDAGRYECVAENGAGRKSVATDITVVGYESIGCGKGHVLFPKPTITKWVKQLLQPLATEARLPCRAVQKHTTAWFGPANRAITGDGNDYTIMPNGDLVIHKLAARDIGTFKCLVSNDNGRDWAETFVYPFVV